MAGISGPAALVATVYNICVNFKMKLFKRNNVVYRQDNVNTLFFHTLVILIVLVTCKDTLEFDYDEPHSGAGMKYQTQVIIQINSKDRYVTYFFIRF